jgi:cytochrome c5
VQQEEPRVKGTKHSNSVLKLTKYVLIGCFALVLLAPLASAHLTGSLSVEAITKRLEPMAKVNVDNAATATAAQPGAVVASGGPKDIYENNCKMCHQTGVAGAPKFGNKADWAPRISQGEDTLVKAAISGIRAMPPKGNCIKCTEAEIKATVEFMMNAAK